MDGQATNNKRYDRQIRIWGAHGQQRLESCRVALLNCGPTGSETLKNLVLGGIAGFTTVDGSRVCAADLGNNFLIDASSLGESRAKVVAGLAKELNDSVSSSYIDDSPEALLASNPAFFSEFTVVIATQMREPDLVRLDEVCREHRVTLVAVRSYGLMGFLRPSMPEHCVVESKPDDIVPDLRLYEPWPELLELAMSYDLSCLDDITHRHLPFALLLIQASQAWRRQHGGLPPRTSAEQRAFKDLLRSMKRSSHDVPLEEENFDEALKAAYHAWSPYAIPSEVRALMADEACSAESLAPGTSVFWIMVAALRQFLEHEGGGVYLPLEGSIPDMHATTDLFLRTQRVYRERAERDVAAVQAHAAALLARAGQAAETVSVDTVRLYCKHARCLRLVRYRPLASEFEPVMSSPSIHHTSCSGGSVPSQAVSSPALGPSLAQCLAADGTQASAALYVLLRAVDRFHAAHGRYPGSSLDMGLEDDMPLLKALAHQVLAEKGAGGAALPDDYVLEMVRFGCGELHVVAAFMGGMAAQEVIKLVTGQFTSLAGSLVYNAMAGSTCAFDI